MRSDGTRQAVRAPAQLVVTGDVERTLSFSLDDLRHSPRKTVMALNEHQADKEELYEGAPLAVLLGQAGVPRGPKTEARRWPRTFWLKGATGIA